MFGREKRPWIAKEVERVRRVLRQQGHALTPLQEGMVAVVAARDPSHDSSSLKELDEIKVSIGDHGRWTAQDEWRISTWFASEIVRTERDKADWYFVSVECDGQMLSCGCPSIDGAYIYLKLYQQLIIEQFYSIGPPWAARTRSVD